MMNKWSAIASACLLWAALSAPSTAAAAERPIRVYLDNKLVKFEVQPILDNGTTLVPFRAIFEKLGLEVGWDEATQTVTGTKDGLAIRLTIDDTEAFVNDQSYGLELAPRLVDGNTLVPLRFVSEASGKEVSWNQASYTIRLKSASAPKETGNSGGTKEPSKPSTSTGPTDGKKSDDDETTDRTKPEKGDYVYPNGNKFTGQLVDGHPEGKGKLVNANGKILFEGTMANGLPSDGRLRSYHDTGQLEFDGQVKNGVAEGDGKQYSSSGKLVYDGTFKNGQREKGTLFYDNGDKYTGPFDNEQPHGVGKLAYKNGDVYDGDFVNGSRDGKGTYKTAGGEKVVGDFRNNKMNGIISHYDKKGTLLSVSEYADDILVRKVNMGNESSHVPNTNPSNQTEPVKAENDRHEKALSELRDRYNKEKKEIDDQIAQIRRDNPGTYATEAAYEKALQEAKTKEKELRDKLKELSGDNSNAAVVARAELEKKSSEEQALVEKIYAKGAAQQRIESLKERLTTIREYYNEDLKRENERHSENVKRLK